MMDRTSKIALYLIVFVIVLMVVAEITRPKSLNWRDSYSANDKIPLGSFVLFNELQRISKDSIIVSDESIFEFIRKKDRISGQSLIFINNYLNFTDQDSNSLWEFVMNGNSVLMSGLYFDGVLFDSLNLEVTHDFDKLFKEPANQEFSSPYLEKNERFFKDVIENAYISSFDTINGRILGSAMITSAEKAFPNLVQIKPNDSSGSFFIHTNPFAFSNYHLLNGKENYAATVLSFLPTGKIIWDEYYKAGRKVIRSPLRFVLTNPPLKWAFYIALISLIIYIIFQGKRRQRVIPVIEPVKNSTVEFTKTIGNLYYQTGEYTSVINKKITYFLEYLRKTYYLNTNRLDDEFISKLAAKAKVSQKEAE
ncbi:MAG: hypothetical protein R3213_12440, partial [Flavobacteriaceae bacterium]|nr:hypothetical protein [Flavobacteriaceae bacterium]